MREIAPLRSKSVTSISPSGATAMSTDAMSIFWPMFSTFLMSADLSEIFFGRASLTEGLGDMESENQYLYRVRMDSFLRIVVAWRIGYGEHHSSSRIEKCDP